MQPDLVQRTSKLLAQFRIYNDLRPEVQQEILEEAARLQDDLNLSYPVRQQIKAFYNQVRGLVNG